MVIPNKLNINGIIWTVNIGDKGEEITSVRGSLGLNQNSHHIISIANNIPQSQQEVIFLHEIIHAIFYQSGLRNRLKIVEKIDDEIEFEEEIIHSINFGLYQVLKDNNLFFGE